MARNKEPNERQLKILEFLADFQEKNGFPPTIREIGEHIGVTSTSQVTYYLKQLSKKNLIERGDHISRSIRILDDAQQYIRSGFNNIVQLPVLGRIVASEPIPIPESDTTLFDSESTVDIARSALPSRERIGDLFALEVQGDSMIDAMIEDGDIIVLRKTQEARNGEMVAVWLDDNNETTLKYFYREGKRIRLQPANPTMQPIYIDNPEQVRIMGKVVMVVRRYESAN